MNKRTSATNPDVKRAYRQKVLETYPCCICGEANPDELRPVPILVGGGYSVAYLVGSTFHLRHVIEQLNRCAILCKSCIYNSKTDPTIIERAQPLHLSMAPTIRPKPVIPGTRIVSLGKDLRFEVDLGAATTTSRTGTAALKEQQQAEQEDESEGERNLVAVGTYVSVDNVLFEGIPYKEWNEKLQALPQWEQDDKRQALTAEQWAAINGTSVEEEKEAERAIRSDNADLD